ncbi:hypothetical protein GCM10011572_19230 [Pseudoduganella buxea]|uniref:Uncharacterized protein n=1 Tax=Pseudoduganella buxea TaxID=1949069 RepID=A0ABQ1KGB7_9BURK|nr:hypothetical protein GCM10011572_19230 [Pseudoduganella buxea]
MRPVQRCLARTLLPLLPAGRPEGTVPGRRAVLFDHVQGTVDQRRAAGAWHAGACLQAGRMPEDTWSLRLPFERKIKVDDSVCAACGVAPQDAAATTASM